MTQETNNKSFATNIALISAMLLIIIGLIAYIIYKKPETIIKSDTEQRLRDSISLLQKQIDSSRVRQSRLQVSYDSLLNVEPRVIYVTREKIKFIFGAASPSQLDSIIRTKWKTRSRYR
jgi:hypothetical protein